MNFIHTKSLLLEKIRKYCGHSVFDSLKDKNGSKLETRMILFNNDSLSIDQ